MTKCSLLVGLLLVEQCISVAVPQGLLHRRIRAAKDAKDIKKDLSTSETRVDPYLYDSRANFLPIDGHVSPVLDGGVYNHIGGVGYGAGLHGAGLATGYGAGLGYGGVGIGAGPIGAGPGLLHRPLVGSPYLGGGGGGGYNGGFIKSGINEGALALGNKGEQILRQQSDGGYSDGSFHQGGGLQQGGYQGVEGYKDNKHHVNDDHTNQLYYNGVQGGRKDIGNGESYDRNQGFSQNAYNALGDNERKGHQKGHQRTGFHKSYHKDESGNDESYYDSDHDEGNHELGKKYGDQYGTNLVSGVRGGQKLNEYSAQHQGQGGFDGNGKLIAQNQGFKDYYGNNGYFNNANRYGQLGGGQSSNYGKLGLQRGYQDGFNNGRNYEGLQGSRYGGGYYDPYMY